MIIIEGDKYYWCCSCNDLYSSHYEKLDLPITSTRPEERNDFYCWTCVTDRAGEVETQLEKLETMLELNEEFNLYEPENARLSVFVHQLRDFLKRKVKRDGQE